MRIQITFAALLVLASVVSSEGALKKSQIARLENATAVVTSTGADMRTGAKCIAVIPGTKKLAFGFGVDYGKGVLTCRQGDRWSSPVFIQISRVSFGPQFGGKQTDLVLLIRNERGVRRLLQDKVVLGGDASIAAGPLGRDLQAATDVQMTAEILAYSRAQGIFAGAALQGGVLKSDPDSNEDLYGSDVDPQEVLFGRSEGSNTRNVARAPRDHNMPPVAQSFIHALETAQREPSVAERDVKKLRGVARKVAPGKKEAESENASTEQQQPAADRSELLAQLDRMEQTLNTLESDEPQGSTAVGTTGSDNENDSRDTARKEQIRELRQQIESLRRSLRDEQQTNDTERQD
jgi:SH3 domain-containing YSC84-like protein 1